MKLLWLIELILEVLHNTLSFLKTKKFNMFSIYGKLSYSAKWLYDYVYSIYLSKVVRLVLLSSPTLGTSILTREIFPLVKYLLHIAILSSFTFPTTNLSLVELERLYQPVSTNRIDCRGTT